MKVTPVLYLDRIEDSLPFWTEQLGYTQTVAVPHHDGLGFVILVRDDTEVMLQSWASLADDAPALLPPAPRVAAGTSLFIEVDELAPFQQRLRADQIVLPERLTFYGMREIGVRAPSGHVVILAEREPGQP